MPSQKKIATVESLKEKVARAKAIYLTDYRGLTHKQLEELHKLVKKAEGEYLIVKNSLLRLASQSSSFHIPASSLTGPTAVLFSFTDELVSLKELYKFIKTLALPKIKFGFIGKTVFDEAELTTLARLPSREVLRGQVVSRLSGPMYGLVYTLNGNLQKLAYVLSQIKR